MGLTAKRISTSSEVDSAIDWLLSHQGPCFLEVATDPEENVFPMVPAGTPVSQMWLEKINTK
jgi:acetolactate synthase-1/2/3 large subunit